MAALSRHIPVIAAPPAFCYIRATMKVDRTMLVVEDLCGDPDASDRAYRHSRTPLERLAEPAPTA